MKFKYVTFLILIAIILCGCNNSNTMSVTANNGMASSALTGAILKNKGTESSKKYKRKDCPVCKGKGWYMSGDGIQKIDCTYCESEASVQAEKSPTNIKR